MHLAEAVSLEGFRRNLRVLEREVVSQLVGETSCCGVTLTQCHALLELSFSRLSLTNLAAALDLDTSTLSRSVDGMVKAGLVERTEDPADRRSVRLALTAAGREKVAQIDGMCDVYYANLLGQLNERDQKCIVRGVKLLAGLMRRARTAPVCAAKEAGNGGQ
jgi:DNA-binding MarR family transcriptional regulator